MNITQRSADDYQLLSFAADDHGLAANSHLLVGPTECALVDAQFLPAMAAVVADGIARTQRQLTAIYITHGHPDHYFGSMELRRHFPNARVVATADVVADIAASFAGKRAFWLARYPIELPEQITLPEVLTDLTLRVDDATIEVVELGPAEGLHDTVCWVPRLDALIAGDLAYNAEHAWLGDQKTDAWLLQLAELQRRFGNVQHVLPGHGASAGPELFAETHAYVQAFVAAARGCNSVATAVAQITSAFPHYRLPLFLQLSMEKWFAVPV